MRVPNDDLLWLNSQYPEIRQRYLGEWVAVSDKRIVGHADTAIKALNQAQRNGYGNPFMHFMTDDSVEAVDWQQRAEQAEALLREWAAPIGRGVAYGNGEYICLYCRIKAGIGVRLDHADDCLTKRTDQHLGEA